MTVVFMFPGQNSRYAGMLNKLAQLNPRNNELLRNASDILQRDLFTHFSEENQTAFASNRDIQTGVFLANHMFLQILEDAGIEADLSMGLSLGEWNHVVHIGAVSFRDALLAVEQRGQLYDHGPRGGMVSVFPIELDELDDVVARASERGVLEIVNYNSPRQHVLSGEQAALDRAMEILDDEHFVHTAEIEKQLPMHSSLFEPVGRRFRAHLDCVPFHYPQLPYLPNRLGKIVDHPRRDDFVEMLSTHVYRPTLWRKSIDFVVERWPSAVFVEVGPMAVLHNLLDKKWRRNKKMHTDSRTTTDVHLQQVINELHEERMAN